MTRSVLIIGGGIAGIQAALDLADAGVHVILVEREPTIGGKMAVLDKNFPTLDCSICIEAPKMSEVDLHPNIDVYTLAEVVKVRGRAGQFTVTVRQRARFVTDECTRCDRCTQVCPVVLPNAFESGMAYRKAIYTPIPQAVPGAYVIDLEHCLNEPPNYLPCSHCQDVCQPKCIDFFMPPVREHTFRVAAIIVATGFEMMDPHLFREYGYGTHPDILTAFEFERLLNSAGPTGGEIIRPSDRRHPKRILFVLCVGSRDRRWKRYCSRFCCMYSIKHAYQAVDHGVPDVTVMYMDLRTYGKGFEGFWERTCQAGARFIRSRPAVIEPEGTGLRVVYEDTLRRRLVHETFDMVVLAGAVAPSPGTADLARRLGIAVDEDGFFKTDPVQGGTLMTTRRGIYVAGCASGPKDIPDSVAEGSGAAGLALRHVRSRRWPERGFPEMEPEGEPPRVGVFVCHCGSNIAGVVDIPEIVEYAQTLPDVVYVQDQMFSCAGNTQKQIEEAIREHAINRVVIAACSPKTHESIFRGVLERAGLNPYLVVMANIRNLNTWVHKAYPREATVKAMDMIAMAVERARRLRPLKPSELPVTQAALVVGGGIAGLTAALMLRRQGFETHLVEKEDQPGGLLRWLDEIAPLGTSPQALVSSLVRDCVAQGVRFHLKTTVELISGHVGNFHATLSDGTNLTVGAVVIATGGHPAATSAFGCGTSDRVVTNFDLARWLASGQTIPGERVTFVGCVESRQDGRECSRYSCTSMIGQALRLRQMGKKVRVLYKDIRTYGRHAEELYEAAMREGVQFIRYPSDMRPEEAIAYADGFVEVEAAGEDQRVRFPTDLLVLVVGLEPAADDLSEQLKLARSADGFYLELHPKLGPVETASRGIYVAGVAQAPKDVRESMAQAAAAAAKAGSLLARGVIEKEPLMAQLDPDRCIACMRCVKVCPFHAIEQIGEVKTGSIRIHEIACMGCGTCAAECNFDAIDMPYFEREQILAQIDAALARQPEAKCLVFTCNWCSYAGADLAGIEKRSYPPSIRVIRTMCSARVEEKFIARAFEKGAGAVLITGCRLTETGSDCHYNQANRLTWQRFQFWQRKYSRKGIAPERFQLQWISAAESKLFAEKMKEMHEIVMRYARARKADRTSVAS